jgi:hypothetical protein
MVSLQQGQKWRTDPLFQQPVLSVNGRDFWVGDLFSTLLDGKPSFLLHSYVSIPGETFGQCYQVENFFAGNIRRYFIEVEICHVPLWSFHQVVVKKEDLPVDVCLSHSHSKLVDHTDEHKSLLFAPPHRMKKQILDGDGVPTGAYYKVKITPITLFTDDTPGNISKQFNKFDTWSMVYAVLPFEDRNRRENTYFLGAVSGTKGLSAVDMVPRIAADLKALEDGVIMYSAEHEEDVLVIAPVLFITADNPRHAELVGLRQSTTLYPCRYCYYQSPRRKTPGEYDDLLNRDYMKRTRDHYCLAAATSYRRTGLYSHQPLQ